MKESKIIQKFYKNNLQDDDCYWDKENKQLISTDSIVEGTHFLHKWSSPKNLAKKIIEVNISDILSSGGIPTKAFLNLGLNHISSKPDWINSFSKEIKNLLSFYKIELCGGDTFYSQNTQITLTLIGKLKLNKPFLRSGGKPGDNVYITGEVGFSLLGFKSLQNKINLPLHFKKKAIITHLAPSCEWKKRNFFQKYNKDIHAMMDITDGLVQDLGKLAKASKLNIKINCESLPDFRNLSKYLKNEEILNSGEELKLLFLSPAKIPKNIGIKIGECFRGNKPEFYLHNKRIFPNKGFIHF